MPHKPSYGSGLTLCLMKREESIDYNIKACWHAIARMYNTQAAQYGGTISIGYILLNIDNEHGTPATKIAPLLGLEARSITRTLKSMEEDGFIYKVQDAKDRRCFRIFLTDRGREVREISRIIVKNFNHHVREAVPDDKLQVFFEVINKVQSVVEKQLQQVQDGRQLIELEPLVEKNKG